MFKIVTASKMSKEYLQKLEFQRERERGRMKSSFPNISVHVDLRLLTFTFFLHAIYFISSLILSRFLRY